MPITALDLKGVNLWLIVAIMSFAYCAFKLLILNTSSPGQVGNDFLRVWQIDGISSLLAGQPW